MNIAPYQPRQFVPVDIDLTETEQLAPLFDQLKERLEKMVCLPELEVWLRDHSELCAAISESSGLAYIRMTCQTDDEEREKAYLKIVEVVDPWLKPRQFELSKLLVEGPWLRQLPPEYEVFRRSVEMSVRLYRPENVARETEQARLSQQYQKLIGAMTVQWEGQERTLMQMARIQEETDRSRREEAWKLMAARRLQDREKLDEIFQKLLDLRAEIAKAADFPDFRAYAFAMYERFDYTPEDCIRFQDSIEKFFVPLARDLQRKRQSKLGVETLRPWDLAVDPDGRKPLRPFEKADELLTKSQAIFSKLDSRLSSYFELLRSRELVDLENRKGKAPGGYQSTLQEARVPFIFMNSVGVHRDIETMVHEAGHAFHAVASRHHEMLSYRSAPIEFCEVASMSMELLTAPHWTEFYSEEDARRARREHLEGIIKFFPWMATVDAFQHWLYTNPGHTAAQREAAWVGLMDRFGGIENWGGWEAARAAMWHRQLHIFEIPFYYVEYGIAQLGALQIWTQAQKDVAAALNSYLNGLRLGGSRPLPELFAAANIRFDFSEDTIAPLVDAVRAELAELAEEAVPA
ncbi:MAG: M3 family oligoendopeptidase [Candidatus Methylacidiphilales bacterium]|nr:M3 family oligoendopeptidase [Candidatus Methylacidiphilales bacterium]